ESNFQRAAEIPSLGIRKELYNLTFDNTVYKDVSIPFNRNVIRDEVLTLLIQNGDDRPINIAGITVQYYSDELVFECVGDKSYTLGFGADSSVKAPIYDIARYKDEILKGDFDRLEIQNIFFEETPPEPELYDYKTIFNFVIITVAVLLGLLIMLKLRKSAGKP
ncbi:MAG: hypothetical protein FWD19_06405, partial [Defluviitaleaceae bacterium]|nr:hypothetical protein [Defluviitaleaceae bacterium]